jgi:hypothetical protein
VPALNLLLLFEDCPQEVVEEVVEAEVVGVHLAY